MVAALPVLAEVEKQLRTAVRWSEPDSDGMMQFVAPLTLGEITIGGLHLRGSCYETARNRAITFQVELAAPGKRTRLPLTRLDWRPLAEPHRNRAHSDLALSRIYIFGSHFHRFDLNWLPSAKAMRSGNLPMAVPLEPDPQTFDSLLDIARKLLKISDIDRVPCPQWTERLL
jgi:hypothetical protein